MRIAGGLHKGRAIEVPKGTSLRPTTEKLRQTVFNILHEVDGLLFLDLFAGVGAMGIEALSRGVLSSTFVEKDRRNVSCIKTTLKNLELSEKGEVFAGDVFEFLKKFHAQKRQFDLIYIDPPYGEGLGLKALKMIDDFALLKKGGTCFLEEQLEKNASLSLSTMTLKSERSSGKATLMEFIA